MATCPCSGSRVRLLRLGAITLALCVLAVACGSGSKPYSAPEQTEIRISGSGTALPVVDKLAAAYSAAHPDVKFSIQPGTNSAGAIQGVEQSTLDLAVVNRPLTAAEREQSVTYTPFAQDAVAFAVNLPSPMLEVSTGTARDIYAGALTNWSQLGGSPALLIVLDRDPDESMRKLFLLPLLGKEVAARTTVLTSAGDMVTTLGAAPATFGYTSVGILHVMAVSTVRPLALDGVNPTAENVKTGAYKWKLTFGFVRRDPVSPAVEGFLGFVNGVAGQQILQGYGYAPP